MNNNNNIYEPISQSVTRCFILGRKLVFPFRLPRIGLTFGTSVLPGTSVHGISVLFTYESET